MARSAIFASLVVLLIVAALQLPGRVRAFSALARNQTGNTMATTAQIAAAPMIADITTTPNAADLQYHGGPVQLHPTSYLIFWGSGWQTSSGALDPSAAIVKRYFADVGNTTFMNVLSQYTDASGTPISPNHTLGGVYVDTTHPLATDTSCAGLPTVHDSAIQSEVSAAIAANGWTPSANATLYVFTSSGTAVNDGNGACSAMNFCAYHDWSAAASVAYAAIAYPDNRTACGQTTSPNGDPAGDSLANLASHVQFGAITDPQPGPAWDLTKSPSRGWTDTTGLEIGDKCNSMAPAIVTLANNDTFALQSKFSDATQSCVTSFTAHIGVSTQYVTAIVTSTNATPAPQRVTITNSGPAALDWSTKATPAWLAGAPTNGRIAAGGSATITLSFTFPVSSSTAGCAISPSGTQTCNATLDFNAPFTDNAVPSIPVTAIAAAVAKTWYFAEGWTGSGFTEYLTLENPNSSSVSLTVTYLLHNQATPIVKQYSIPGNRRATLTVNHEIGANQSNSIVVQASAPIVAERAMYIKTSASSKWPAVTGGMDVRGATSLGTDYAFPLVDSTSQHSTYLTILNLNTQPMTVTTTYFPSSGATPIVTQHVVPAHQRGTIHVNTDKTAAGTSVPAGTYSALMHLSEPGMVERAMYFVDAATHIGSTSDVVGVLAPLSATTQSTWYFGDGNSDTNWYERYIIANPCPGSTNGSAPTCGGTPTARVTLTLFDVHGNGHPYTMTVAAGHQVVFNVNQYYPTKFSNSATVQAVSAADPSQAVPIIADRFMLMRYSGWTGSCRCPAPNFPGAIEVTGTDQPSQIFYYSEGWTGSNFGEYLAVANFHDIPMHAKVTLLPAGGAPITFTVTIQPQSRYTKYLNSVAPNTSFAMVVVTDQPTVTERAMYFSWRTTGPGAYGVIGYQP